MVSEKDSDQTLDNTTCDGNQTEETAVAFFVVCAARSDPRTTAGGLCIDPSFLDATGRSSGATLVIVASAVKFVYLATIDISYHPDVRNPQIHSTFEVVRGRILGQRLIPFLMEVCFEIRLKEDRTNAMSIWATPTIDFVAFSARSSTSSSDKHNGKLVPVYEHCKKQWHTKEQCWKLHGRPLGGNKHLPNDRQNTGRAYVNESAGPSQPPYPHYDSLAPVVGNGKISPYAGLSLHKDLNNLSSQKMIDTVWHSMGFYLLRTSPLLVAFLGLVLYLPILLLLNKIITTSSGKWWFETFIDDHTRLTWVFLLSKKSKVTSIFRDFYNTIEMQFNTKIAILRSDNAFYLYGDAALTAAHLINQMSYLILHLQTPLECFKESYPFTRLILMFLFECLSAPLMFITMTLTHLRLPPRAQACVFVGYPLHHRGYKCFHPSSCKYFVSMEVTFLENHPFFSSSLLHGEIRILTIWSYLRIKFLEKPIIGGILERKLGLLLISRLQSKILNLYEIKYYANGEAWHLPDGAYATLGVLKDAGVRLAVVSNFDTRLRKLLKDLSVLDMFDAVIISAEVGYEKPDGKIFEAALDQLEVRSDNAVHVGDDQKADKEGANAVGIDCWLWGSDVMTFEDIQNQILVRASGF
ncbi:haloacid dehalogenase-like hydrolase domain-containing protein 3 [Cucumis melo var. makuwa]|uniref:Haloacid dehalogenase-like hydrolase domain-containing protein 3 n=1 Tax=Cucumis melo var. makuwa TaxID=1194695 RepID=A0A5D3BJY0_CUCMM|nr:haloacid dehalogenase-like hydrolase domain-containing protein 3 [Cucumis melo var. makuwa]